MSDREKKLVLLFGLAAFVLVNVFAISWLREKKSAFRTSLIKAEGEVAQAEAAADNFDTVIEEMDWLGEKMPQPRSGQLVATELETYASNQATINQLTVKRRAIKPNDETGFHFHRAKVEFNVNGKEDGLYRWLSRLQMPDQFRAVTFMRLAPDAKDDTLIDAVVEVEQWYRPLLDDLSAPGSEEVESDAPPEIPPAPSVPPVPGNPDASVLPVNPETANPPGTE